MLAGVVASRDCNNKLIRHVQVINIKSQILHIWREQYLENDLEHGWVGYMLNEAQGTVQLNVTWVGWVTC